MAKNNNLTDFLTDLADGIRAKKGITGTINPQNFRSEIASIETGKPEQAKTVTPTKEEQKVLPDEGYALSEVTVNAIQTEKFTVTPTKNSQTLLPGTGKYWDEVTVKAIPDDYIIPWGTIDITENGTYDVSGKANAVVNVPIEKPTLYAPSISLSGRDGRLSDTI